MKGLVFNIQRFSLNDGDGIRSIIFLKGCSLRCPWCSNPESISTKIQRVKNLNKCLHCNPCYNSPLECPTNSLEDIGYYIGTEDIIDEVMKDEVFFRESGGGITFSGGESLLQSDFVFEVSRNLKSKNINTAIETSGHVPFENFKKGIEYIDHLLFDMKILNSEKFNKILKGNLDLVLKNLEYAVKINKRINLRFPLIPTYTDDEENISKIISICKKYKIYQVDLLPYHNFGINKYELIRKDYKLYDLPLPSDEEVQKIKSIFEKENIKIKIKG